MTKKVLLCFIFFFFSPVIIFSLIFYGDYFKRGLVLGEWVSASPQAGAIYASLSDGSKIILPTIKGENSTSIIIENYLRRFNSPLLPYVDLILDEAEKYGVDPKLIVAIAQQESNLGKNSPQDCYNAWGWGIHAKGTKCYNSWPEAIESVIKGIAKDYCAKGYCDDACIMMKRYTPKSNGSWCTGIKQFISDMETGDF